MHKTLLRYVALWCLAVCLAGIPLTQAQQLDMDLLKAMKPRSIGPAGMSGRVTGIDVVLSNPDIIYVATASGGLWRSTSGGTDWQPLFDKERLLNIGSVAIYQKNPDIIWAGTGEGNPRNSQSSGAGIYRSIDGGRSWQLMGLEKTRNIHRIVIHPDNPDVVYAGVQGSAWGDHSQRGVYKTTNGGKTWKKILYINQRTGVADMVVDPTNPDKLIVAMWEFRRWPWFFKSGGKGSGLYVTVDGGKTWNQRTADHGLPKGDLGRMGLAIAPSKPNVVYALVEAKKNGVYKSTDGGYKWAKISEDANAGNRPFYYADIFVDPKNENRVYSLWSMVSRSEDGGKNWKIIIPYSGVHPDHHAFWVHPEDPDYIIEGNDGGLVISRDGAKTWRFIENLPLAQYYHINVDNDIPYNVYGGMQDNGSWRGPAYVWRTGGIRNAYFEELYFGDGFDVVPDPDDNRYGYAMSQGGFVGRYDFNTKNAELVRPVHPEGVELRFNWDAAIALDPQNASTVYYGSQFVHKSTDKGRTWQVISPDLTTNDPEKQKQDESGGLTFDVTNAENHTTITALAPSPLNQQVVWVGTDDGNVQLTRDGGANWTNLTANIKDVPAGSYVEQVKASAYNEAEAFAVINNYRRNDWKPYVYHTSNYGRTWMPIVKADQIYGYALSMVQDLEEPKLLFLGTEFGLYVSIDKGKNWTKWHDGFPSASTMDLVIQPREHDLVIGTFGRAAWVLDDIRPLRALAQQGADVLKKDTVRLYDVPDAYLTSWGQASGTRFAADAIFSGQNRPYGARITVSTVMPKAKEEGAKATDSLKLEVFDDKGMLIRTLKMLPDTGMTRFSWRLDYAGVRYPTQAKPKKPRPEYGGFNVLPGTYGLKVTYRSATDSGTVVVKPDPRADFDRQAHMDLYNMRQKMNGHVKVATAAADQLREARTTIDKLMPMFNAKDSTHKAVKKMAKEMRDSLTTVLEELIPKEKTKGIVRSPKALSAKMGLMGYYLETLSSAPTQNHANLMAQIEAELSEKVEMVNGLMSGPWADFRRQVEALQLSPFKDYNSLQVDE